MSENIQPKYQNIWSPRYIDAPILRDENTDQDFLCDDQRLYYLTDANHNVTTLTNTTGDAIEHYQYDPYGKSTIYNATWSTTRSTSSYDNVVLYTGRERDKETGLYCYRNRYYSTELGRFIDRDPIGYAATENLYVYVSSAPVGRADPFGQEEIDLDVTKKGIFHDWNANGTINHVVHEKWEVIMTLSGSNCDCPHKGVVVCKQVSPGAGTRWITALDVKPSNNKPIVMWGVNEVWKALKAAEVLPKIGWRGWTYGTCMTISPGEVKTVTVYRRVDTRAVIGKVTLYESGLEWLRKGWDNRGNVSIFGSWKVYTTVIKTVVKTEDCP